MKKCKVCGKSSGKYAKCDKHRKIDRDRQRIKIASRKLRGVCVNCVSNKSLEHNNLCLKCWLKDKGRNLGSSWKKHGKYSEEHSEALLEILERQGYKCALTGIKLIPGLNASIDHIKPQSKYPELAKDYTNLQWVCSWANIAKNTLEQDEFIAMCIIVAKHNT